MADLLSRRTIPPQDADAPELPHARRLPEEVADAYESLSAEQQATIDWARFDGPIPPQIEAVALRSARSRIMRALESVNQPGPSDDDCAIAYWRDTGARTRDTGDANTIRDLGERAVKRFFGIETGPVAPTERRALELLDDAINNTVKQRVKKATDVFTDRTILNIVECNLTPRQRDALIGRYRGGAHRKDLTDQAAIDYRDAYRRLRKRLVVNTLLQRIFSAGVLSVLDARYRWDRPVTLQHLGTRGWSINRCLALEFECMQEIVAVVTPNGQPHEKKLELPHALLPEHLEMSRLHFQSGLSAPDVARQLGADVPVLRVEQALWDVVETLRWLFDSGRAHGRYLNMGRYQPAPKEAREELARACAGGTWDTAVGHTSPASRTAICSILRLGV